MNIFTPTEVKKHFPNALERTYSAGQIIFYHGDAPNYMMFIKSGAVKFYDTDTDGNEKIMHIGGEGSIFPLFYSFEDKKAVDAFYATIAETEVLIVPLSDFQNKLKSSAEYAFHTLRWYAEEMDHIVLRLKSLEKSSAKQKILQALFYLSGQHATTNKKKPGWHRINFPLTQQTLADMTGLTRETVNITLKDPEILELVRVRRQIFEIFREKIAASLE
ncbi:MAG: Crp/Fnr family transcriptional regulator [Candidatus Microsaccharimonas sp.]